MTPPLLISTLSDMMDIYKTFKVELDLSHNSLTTFPNPNVMFGFKKINLTRLELSHNNIKTINAEDILPSLQVIIQMIFLLLYIFKSLPSIFSII